MKIAHIADLHIGKIIHGYSMLEEQKQIFEQIILKCIDEQIEVLIIAGDVFDRPVASAQAIDVFELFLEKLVENKIKTLIIGGNHDGYTRLSYAKRYLQMAGVYIKADYDNLYEKIRIGTVDFYLVNHFDPIHVQQISGLKIATHDEMMEYVSKQIKCEFDEEQTNVLIAHGYFANLSEGTKDLDYEQSGLLTSDSERPLSIGTSDIVNINYFSNFDYIALGHLHQAQNVGENGYYAGAIYPYAFNERVAKGMYIFETEKKIIEFHKFFLKRTLKTIKTTYEKLLENPEEIDEDYVEIIFSEEVLVSNLMDKIKIKYPNTMLIRSEKRSGQMGQTLEVEELQNKSITDLFSDFCQNVYQYETLDEEKELLTKIIEEENAST